MKDKVKPRKEPTDVYNVKKSVPEDYPWKLLGWLTQDLAQFLAEDDLALVRAICRARDIDGIRSLSELWGLQSMPLGSVLTQSVAKLQLGALLKKFEFPTDAQMRKANAIQKFLDGEAACAAYNDGGYTALSVAKDEWMVDVFTYAQSFLQQLLGFDVPDLSELSERSRHGPGATTGTDPGKVSSYFKFENWPYRCTARALGLARSVIENDERWLGALEDDYRERYNIPKHAILNRKRFWDSVLVVDNADRIAFVPKDAKTLRTITIGPTMNLYLQLGVDGYIRRRLKRWGVDLDCQLRNQELARIGSLGGENPFVTLDLANASNCISLKLCKLLLPADWYDLLVALRSEVGILDGHAIRYSMFSAMGNGYTFVLESAIFTALVYAVMKSRLGVFNREDFAVYGDDIIVRQDLAPYLIEALTNCGFKLNLSKSFLDGPCRESCGADWYLGRPVRPVFLRTKPCMVDELFTDYNRIKRFLALRFGIEESVVLRRLMSWIPETFRGFVGPLSDEDFASYIHSAEPPKYRKGFGFSYRRCVYKFRRIVRKPVSVRADKLGFRKLMHDLHPVPLPSPKWERGVNAGCSGRFQVVLRGRYTWSVVSSSASYWQSEYTG